MKKALILGITFTMILSNTVMAADISSVRQRAAQENYERLYGTESTGIEETDPDFAQIKNNFIYGDIYEQGNLDDQTRELINIVVLTTSQTMSELKLHVRAALNVDITPEQIKEAVYQCAPYIGISKTEEALYAVNEVFEELGIDPVVESQTTVAEGERFVRGNEIQTELYNMPTLEEPNRPAAGQPAAVSDYLPPYCFGDFYTRDGLDLKTRELLTFCILVARGDCDPQLQSHITGNLNAGNDRTTLISALNQCLPYVGFSRSLNTMNYINELAPETEQTAQAD